MKKVLIITLFGNFNFGNKLQNYALQHVLEKLNCKVNTVKIKYASRNIFKYIARRVLDIKKRKQYNDLRIRAFEDFNDKYISYEDKFIYNNYLVNPYSKKYDYFIYGSDQIWNPVCGGNSDLFLGNFDNKNNISYAASFGISELPTKYHNRYKKMLSNFKNISVREYEAKKIVKSLTGRKDVEVLVDPTMLLTKGEWKKVAQKPKNMIKKKYILNYFLGEMSPERSKIIYEFAKANDLEVINILDKNDKFYEAGPSEFVYLEEHAQLICTDSFHSCVFGILMETPFVVFDREDSNKPMNSRIDTLLSKFKLGNRIYKGELKPELLQCDFSHCGIILEEEKDKSYKFLMNALDYENK